MIFRSMLVRLLAVVVVLPIALVLLMGVSRLLVGLGDEWGGVLLDRIALLGGIAWGVCLVGLLIVLALSQLREKP